MLQGQQINIQVSAYRLVRFSNLNVVYSTKMILQHFEINIK